MLTVMSPMFSPSSHRPATSHTRLQPKLAQELVCAIRVTPMAIRMTGQYAEEVLRIDDPEVVEREHQAGEDDRDPDHQPGQIPFDLGPHRS